jgi:hypothetical protein
MTRTISPRIKLARLFGRFSRQLWPELARRAGVTSKQVVNLVVGQPISANAYLRLCVVIEHDPLPELAQPMGEVRPADLDQVLFALGFRLRRGLNKHTMRQAGEACQISAATVMRLERGEVMSIGVVLRSCAYVGVHPFGYLRTVSGARSLIEDGKDGNSVLVVGIPSFSRETLCS